MTKKEFEKKFLKTFAKNITEKQQKKFKIAGEAKGLLWNVFQLVPCYEGNQARIEYEKVDKTGAVEVLYDSPCMRVGEFYCGELEKVHNTAEGIDNSGLVEFYIMGKDFAWCYVVTHAGDSAGPYFCYAPE